MHIVVGLVVNDGFVDSVQSTVQVLAVSSVTSSIQGVQDLQNIISGLPSNDFRNKNMQNTLLNKLNAVIKTIAAGEYEDALSQMQNDILNKTNGCALTGTPNKTDWITTCDAQGPVYTQIQIIIANLSDLQ